MTNNPGTRVGVIVSHPIQYFSPLFDLLNERGRMDLRVLYGNDAGLRPQLDPGFNVEYQWDLDLVSKHDHDFATRGDGASLRELLRGVVSTFRFVKSRDEFVIHGWVGALTVAAIAACWLLRKPYWLRSDTSARRHYRQWDPREFWPRLVYRRSRGALAAGQRNAAMAIRLGAPSAPVAPFAVDNARFARAARHPQPRDAPAVVFAGKFIPAKRPGDVLDAAKRLPAVKFLMVGGGPLDFELRTVAENLPNVTFGGFKNQTEMPAALATADVVLLPSEYEPWGLIVNEAMACGLVPVVSDAVGCAPDLVTGLGQTFPTGNIHALCGAIEAGLATAGARGTGVRLWERVEQFSLDACALAYESALTGRQG